MCFTVWSTNNILSHENSSDIVYTKQCDRFLQISSLIYDILSNLKVDIYIKDR